MTDQETPIPEAPLRGALDEQVAPPPPTRKVRLAGRKRFRLSGGRPFPWGCLFPVLILIVGIPVGWWAYQHGKLDHTIRQGHEYWAWLTNNEADHSGHESDIYWTCPMHPQIIKDRPGDCPICGMTLVEKTKEQDGPSSDDKPDGQAGHSEPGMIMVDPRVIQMLGVTTEVVGRRALDKEIRTTGDVTYDETQDEMIHSWVAGRIDKLYVDFTGQVIKKGQPVAEIYSPQLVSSQEELVLALKYAQKLKESDALPEAIEQSEELVEAARTRLSLWGMTDDQIAHTEKSRKMQRDVVIHAAVGGTVVEKMAHVGLYVKEGSPLYRVADLNRLWVYVAIYEKDLHWVKVGQWVDLTTQAHPGTVFRGQITFIDPAIEVKSRTAQVRIEIPNADMSLLPGMYMIARLKAPISAKALAVPDSAVIRTGKRDVVILSHGEGRMAPREVVVGPLVDGYYQVLSGLHGGERVVTQASFLIDSESQLKSALQRMGGGGGGMPGMKH